MEIRPQTAARPKEEEEESVLERHGASRRYCETAEMTKEEQQAGRVGQAAIGPLISETVIRAVPPGLTVKCRYGKK